MESASPPVSPKVVAAILMIQRARVISATLLTVALACSFIILPLVRLQGTIARAWTHRSTIAMSASDGRTRLVGIGNGLFGAPSCRMRRTRREFAASPGITTGFSVDPRACLAANPDSILRGGSNPHGSARSAQRCPRFVIFVRMNDSSLGRPHVQIANSTHALNPLVAIGSRTELASEIADM